MKMTNSILRSGKFLCIAIFTGALFLVSATNTHAQESAAGTLNPYTHIANKLDVTAYQLGTFERTHTMDVLEQILDGLKPVLSNGGGTLNQRLKYDYCNRVLQDIHTNYMAVEISLLTGLSGVTEVTSTTGIQQTQLRTLYNEIVAQIQ